MVDLGSKLLWASLSGRTAVEGSRRRAKYQGHEGQRSANSNTACQRDDVQKTIETICIFEYSLAEGKRISTIMKDISKFILTRKSRMEPLLSFPSPSSSIFVNEGVLSDFSHDFASSEECSSLSGIAPAIAGRSWICFSPSRTLSTGPGPIVISAMTTSQVLRDGSNVD